MRDERGRRSGDAVLGFKGEMSTLPRMGGQRRPELPENYVRMRRIGSGGADLLEKGWEAWEEFAYEHGRLIRF